MPQCFEPGDCLGALISGAWAMTANECIDRCKSEPECHFFNYNNDKYCALLKDCSAIDSRCIGTNDCIYGEVTCERQHEYAMIATGYDGVDETDSVEIIDLDTFKSCPIQQKSFPYKVNFATALKNNDIAMICGGYNNGVYYSDCYEYRNVDWALSPATLNTNKLCGISVEIRPNEWIVLGGQNEEGKYLNSTEIFKNGIFTPGPKMPESFAEGSAVMFNITHLFVASGASNRNWFVDIKDWTWTELAQRILTAHQGSASGIYHDYTLDQRAIATLGYNGIQIYYPILNSWVEYTTPLLEGLGYARTLQLSTEYFLITGGREYPSREWTKSIHRFDTNGLSLIEENALEHQRFNHIAITIPEEQINCY